MTVLTILIRKGTYIDFMTLSLITSGAVATDMEVRIFAMNDAVWALKKENVGKDTVIPSLFPNYSDKVSSALNEGKLTPWWELLADLKELGDVTITVCALIADIVGLKREEEFHELVDEIAGVANFAADIEDSDFVLSI